MENFIPYKADIQEVEESESFDYDGPTEEEERAQYEHDKACETRLGSSMAVESIDRASNIRYAYNSSGKDKSWGNYSGLTTEFKDTLGDLNSVMDHVKSGHALCAGNLDGKRREKPNFVGSQWILIDIDNTSIETDDQGNSIKVYKPELTIDAAWFSYFLNS